MRGFARQRREPARPAALRSVVGTTSSSPPAPRAANLKGMSVQLIHAYFEAFNGQHESDLLAMLDDEVIHDINQGAREIGRDKFREFLARMNECYREQIVDLAVMSDVTGTR